MKIKLLVSLSLTVLSCGIIFSADNFRNHRYDSFKATPTQEGEIVFAGNSITHMHSWFEAFGSHQEIIGRGNSGAFASELLDNLENYIDSKPSKFFLLIGTNDINSGETAENTAGRIMTIVHRIRLESPETEVYVQSILPRSSNPKPDYEKCNDIVGSAIEAMYDPKVHFVNLSEVCAKICGNEEWSHDGLHPRPVGYAAWTHHIEDIVGYPSVYPDVINNQNSCGLVRSEAARVEQFPYYPIHEGDVLFFGDEQVHGGEWHELLGSNRIKDRGVKWGRGGINLKSAKSVVRSSLENLKDSPSKIFFFYGLGDHDSEDYAALIDEAESLVPRAKFYLVSMTPSSDNRIDSDRVAFNKSLESLADCKKITYVDVYTPLRADIDKNIMPDDYISGRGYIVMANELAKYLKEENVSPVSLEAYTDVYTRRSIRKIIGDALTVGIMSLNGYCNYAGEINSGTLDIVKRNAIEKAVKEAIEVINLNNLTSDLADKKADAIYKAVKQE